MERIDILFGARDACVNYEEWGSVNFIWSVLFRPPSLLKYNGLNARQWEICIEFWCFILIVERFQELYSFARWRNKLGHTVRLH